MKFQVTNPNDSSKLISKQIGTSFIPSITLTQIKDLPSKGKAYPEGAVISYRPFSFGEVKRISGSINSNEEPTLGPRAVFDIIMEGIEANFDKNLITIPDAMYISVLRKISTLGSTEVIVRYPCNKCGRIGSFVFKTDETEFNDLNIELPVVIDFSFGTVEFSPLDVAGYLKLIEMGKVDLNGRIADEISIYAMQSNLKYEDAYEKFSSSIGDDNLLLNEVDRLLYHGLKPLSRKCNNDLNGKPCNNNLRIELDGGQALLLPFRKDNSSLQARIRFGVQGKR